MTPIAQFLKALGSLLRKGELSYDDALKRFKAQYGRNAEGVEQVAIKSEIEKAPPFQGWKPEIVGKDKKVGTVEELIEGKPHKDKRGRTWQFGPRKKGEVVDLFASEKEFVSDLYSMNQNFIKNDPLFNLELATKLRNPGVKTYGWTPSGDKSKLLSPKQRQTALDKLKSVMKHDTYQAQHAEELGYVDLTDDIFTIEKAEGGRIGMGIGGFTKAQVLIQMLKNTLKGSKDPYVKKTFPNFIKELQKNPELALDENVWKNFTTGLPKNQRLIVHSDDSVDFFRQTEFGPHNIEKTLEFQKKHNLSREQANTILKMEPEDRVLEMKRLETIRNKTMQAEGGRVPLMYGGDPGFAFEYGGSWADWHEKHRDTMPVEQYIQTKLPKERLPFREMEEGGRAGFPFGGRALKAIRDAFRANKTWGVGGPPYRPEKTSFDIKALTKENLGKEFTLKELKEVSESPFADFASRGQGRAPPTFNEFNKEFKIIKARILKTKLEESKAQAEAMIESAKVVPADNPTAKKVQAQFTRDGKKQLEEAIEGLKEIDIYMGMLQKKGRSLHQSGGLAYMLGEPTYMKYSAGGSVGHAPWLKPTAQQQPQGQDATPTPQVGGAQTPGGGRPNPMKAPRGLPSLAPRTMDPAYMQQQMMQKAMMGQQRPGMEEGGITPTIPEQFLEDFKRRKYEDILDEYHRWKEDYERRKDLAPTQEAAGGGRIGFGLGSMSRRAFLKMMAAVAALPLVGKGATKVAPKVIPKVTETVARGADGMPVYITDLIEVVKAKGTKDIIEGFKRSDYSTVHSYKGVEVVEDGAGNIKIKKPTEGVATDASTGKMHEGTSQEVHIEINKGGMGVKDEGLETQKTFQEPDEYFEGTVRPDMDGKMKDF